MKLLMKKSHCFAFAVFAGAAGGMATIQVLRAMKDASAWSDMPAVLLLQTLGCGLLAIAFNYTWLSMLGKADAAKDDVPDYAPNRKLLPVFALTLGAVILITLLAKGLYI